MALCVSTTRHLSHHHAPLSCSTGLPLFFFAQFSLSLWRFCEPLSRSFVARFALSNGKLLKRKAKLHAQFSAQQLRRPQRRRRHRCRLRSNFKA